MKIYYLKETTTEDKMISGKYFANTKTIVNYFLTTTGTEEVFKTEDNITLEINEENIKESMKKYFYISMYFGPYEVVRKYIISEIDVIE